MVGEVNVDFVYEVGCHFFLSHEVVCFDDDSMVCGVGVGVVIAIVSIDVIAIVSIGIIDRTTINTIDRTTINTIDRTTINTIDETTTITRELTLQPILLELQINDTRTPRFGGEDEGRRGEDPFDLLLI